MGLTTTTTNFGGFTLAQGGFALSGLLNVAGTTTLAAGTITNVSGGFISTGTLAVNGQLQLTLGSSRLAEVIDRHQAVVAFHGHAHHGKPEGKTIGGIPVHNVALSLLMAQQPPCPYRVVEI